MAEAVRVEVEKIEQEGLPGELKIKEIAAQADYVSNAIDGVKQQRNHGMTVGDAMVDAGKDRIRPIFMTTLTTVGGMIPLAFATGASSGYQSPLAVVIISGLLFSTFITLILIPSIYLVFEDIGRGLKRLFSRKRNKKIENPEEIRA